MTATKVCPDCHNQNVPSQAAFCPLCGHSLPVDEVCPMCQTPRPLQGDVLTCGNCGYQFETPRSGSSFKPEPQPGKVHSQSASNRQKKVISQPTSSRGVSIPKILITGAIAIILAIVALSMVAFFVLPPKPVDSKLPAAVPTPESACSPMDVGDFIESDKNDLNGDMKRNYYFASGQEYRIAENSTFSIPDGKTLIIQPGARIRFGEGARMVVYGKLSACGRGSSPILFTADSSVGRPGFWAGIELRDADAGTVIGNATFEFAGRDGHAPLWIENTDLPIENLKFDHNQWYAISFSADNYPLVYKGMLTGGIETENGPQGWEVRGGHFTKQQTWSNSVPLVINGPLEVDKNAVLGLPAETQLKFQVGDSALRVRGQLRAAGESGKPVVFTSSNDGADNGSPDPKEGDWDGIQFVEHTDGSFLENVEVRYGGKNSHGCLYLENAAPVISGVNLSNCNGFAFSTDLMTELDMSNINLSETDPRRRWELRAGSLTGTGTHSIKMLQTMDGSHIYPVITGWVEVKPDGNLSIDAGSVILFGAESSGLYATGDIQIAGVDEKPVIFTSVNDPDFNPSNPNAKPGDWAGIYFENSSSDAIQMSNVQIRYGGAKDVSCIGLKNASPTVTGLTVSDCKGYPISVDAASRPSFNGLNLKNNVLNNVIEIRGSSLDERAVWAWDNIKDIFGNLIIRRVTGEIIVGSSANLTLAPGLVIHFKNPEARLTVRGALLANGTPEQPITLTSWRDKNAGGSEGGAQPGDWGGIQLENRDGAKKISSVIVRYGGNESWKMSCISLSSSAATLTDVSVSNCGYYPAGSDIASEMEIKDLTFADNTWGDTWLIRDSRLLNGTKHSMKLLTQKDGTTRIPYVVSGWIAVDPGAALTLESGTVLKFVNGGGLWAGGSLTVSGSPSAPVILTSSRDPEFSAASGVQAGDWIGLFIETIDGQVSLSNLEIRYGGASANPRGCLILKRSAPTINGLTVRDCAWYPISMDINSQLFPANLSFIGNLQGNAVEVIGSKLDKTGELVWSPLFDASNAPLLRVITGVVEVGPDSTLKVSENVIVKFDNNGQLNITGSLLAHRTIFTSLRDDEYGGNTNGDGAGDTSWQGIKIYSRKQVIFDNTLIRYASTGLWLENSAVNVTSFRVWDCSESAINSDFSSSLNVTSFEFLRNQVNGVILRSDKLPEGETHWQVIGTTGTQVIRVILFPITIDSRSQLVIEPGVIVKFGNNGQLVVEGGFQTGAPSQASVVLTTLADDTGGDTDNGSQSPTRGAWKGITVSGDSGAVHLSMDSTEIRYAQTGLFLENLPNWDFSNLIIISSQFLPISCDTVSNSFLNKLSELHIWDNGDENLFCPSPGR